MTEDIPDDGQLLQRIRHGDEAAFAILYERHQSAIYRFARHMTGSNAIAEEITQEVFMLLIRSPKSYDSTKGTLASYLFGAARNLARRATHDFASDIPLGGASEAEAYGAPQSIEGETLAALMRAENLALLNKALLRLPALYREVIVLCDIEEISYADAAKILDCSAGTVASRLHRAHAILKTRLLTLAGKQPCLA